MTRPKRADVTVDETARAAAVRLQAATGAYTTVSGGRIVLRLTASQADHLAQQLATINNADGGKAET